MIPKGIDGIPASTIPDDPAAFVQWFKSVGIKRWLANADVRNAIPGTGIAISGDISTNATIALSSEIHSLFAQPFVLVGSPILPAVLTDYRSIAGEATVVSITDGGATSAVTIGIDANGIGNAQLRQGAAVSVIGNATAVIANVVDIVSGGDKSVLHQSGTTLSFSTVDHTFISDFAAAVPQGASPTAKVGASVVNGSAATFMRSDAAPPVDLTFTPTWTGAHKFNAGLGLNGNSAPAQVTGWGTPTGQAVVSSFAAGATPSLLQMSEAVAQIITDLKALGLYGA